MMSLQNRIGQTLQRYASGYLQATDLFAVGRVQTIGEPALWNEQISFERGGLQCFSRTRSPADEGGAVIGKWWMPADDWRATNFINALNQVHFTQLNGDSEIMPGMDIIDWSCVTPEGTLDLLAIGSSPVVPQMIPIDMEFRRLANDLETARHGASLRLAIQAQLTGTQVAVRVALINDGNRPCIIINQFLTGTSELDFFRLELATMPEEAEDETGYGAEFAELESRLASETSPDIWQDTYLLLRPGVPLILPETAIVDLPQPGHYLLRAVYSNYGLLDQVAGVPVIRGRAFSNEAELSL